MKLKFIVESDYYLRSQNAIIPFDVLKREWKNQVGKYTADGDLVLEVQDVGGQKFTVTIEALTDNTIRMFGGVMMPQSFSFE